MLFGEVGLTEVDDIFTLGCSTGSSGGVMLGTTISGVLLVMILVSSSSAFCVVIVVVWNIPVEFCDDCVGPEAEKATEDLKPGSVILMENLRYYSEETAGDVDFASQLSKLGDCVVVALQQKTSKVAGRLRCGARKSGRGDLSTVGCGA